MNTNAQLGQVSLVLAILGFTLGFGSLWWSRGEMVEVWKNPEGKQRYEEHEAKTTEAYRAAMAARQLREETGDQRWKRVEQDLERKSFASNPYRPERVRGPRDPVAYQFAAVCLIFGLAAAAVFAVCVARAHVASECSLPPSQSVAGAGAGEKSE